MTHIEGSLVCFRMNTNQSHMPRSMRQPYEEALLDEAFDGETNASFHLGIDENGFKPAIRKGSTYFRAVAISI